MEVIVVLGVIAVLVALLLPTLGRARERARTARCRSNLQQIGIGLRLYLDDHGHYPRNLTWLRLDPWELWVCPSRRVTEPRNRDYYPQDYLENAVGSGSGLPTLPHLGVWKAVDDTLRAGEQFGTRLAVFKGRLDSEIVAPADMLTVGELYRWLMEVILPPTPSDPFGWGMCQNIEYRHYGRANSLFGDNHVETDKPEQLVGPSEVVRRRWNYDNLPHNENWR